MKFIFPTLLSAGLAALSTASGAPRIIAHRGASHAAPENTLASMDLAWKEGADGVEGDFHLTQDGEIVCIHDADTLRTTGVKWVVKDTPWAELAKLDAGHGEKIPRFAEMLERLPAGKLWFVEIKSGPEVVAPIKAVLDSHAGKFDPKALIFISFDAKSVAEARRLLPDYPAHLISSLKEYGDPEKMQKLDATLTRTGANGLQFQYKPAITSAWVGELKARGLTTTAWIVDNAALATTVADYGVDFITTNRPGPLRAEIAAAK